MDQEGSVFTEETETSSSIPSPAKQGPSSSIAEEITGIPPNPTSTLPKILTNAKSTERDLRNSRCCFHFTKFETFIFILGISGIILAVGKISVIAIYLHALYDNYPERSTYYLCGVTIALAAIGLIWEIALLILVKNRTLAGLQQWMFAMMLLWLGSVIGAVVTGAVYSKMSGLILSMSFVADVIRIPPQMFLVHKFIKFEKLDEDSHYVAAYYKKF